MRINIHALSCVVRQNISPKSCIKMKSNNESNFHNKLLSYAKLSSGVETNLKKLKPMLTSVYDNIPPFIIHGSSYVFAILGSTPKDTNIASFALSKREILL